MTRGAVAVLAAAAPAAAQVATVDHTPDFNVDRLAPAPGPGSFLQVEDAQILAARATSFRLVASAATGLLVVRDPMGRTLSEPVSFRVGTEISGAVGLFGPFQLGLAVPFIAYQRGDRLRGLDFTGPDADMALPAAALSDLRVHAKLRLRGAPSGYGFAAAVAGVVTLPTGGREGFSGERGVVLEGRGIVSWKTLPAVLGAQIGLRARTTPVTFVSPTLTLGEEVSLGLGIGVDVTRRADLYGEVAAAVGLGDTPSAAEARLGARYRATPAVSVGAFVGFGMGSHAAVGAPGVRGGLEARYEPSPSVDADGDGIPDVRDRCPAEPEDRDGFSDDDGCPDPDNDGDGVPDFRDRCPGQAEDRDNVKDDDGCPDPDNDGDGVPDDTDRCPLEPEDRDRFSDEDGCPDPDNDNDGVADDVDRCPLDPEDRDGWQDEDGCPDPDNDGDGVPDEQDLCPTQAEDQDGWQDGDGCPEPDDDRDGVADAEDRCPDRAGTEPDGCPHGPPLAGARPDGSLTLRFALEYVPGTTRLAPNGARIVRAMAAAAHHAGWDEAPGDALVVTVPGDGPSWSDLASRRSLDLCRRLQLLGVRCRVEARAHVPAATFRATAEALAAGARIVVRGALLTP